MAKMKWSEEYYGLRLELRPCERELFPLYLLRDVEQEVIDVDVRRFDDEDASYAALGQSWE
jgi:hypothetical protein